MESSVIINRDVIINNLKEIDKNYNNYKKKIVSMKYNAYNHGYVIINDLVNNGINSVVVNNLNEAISIRKYNLEIDIIVMQEINKEYIYDAIVNNLILVVTNMDYLKELYNLDLKDKVKIHLEIDTGMNNVGIKSRNLFKNAVEIIKNHKYLELDGVFTNLEDAKDYEEYISEFKSITKDVNLSNINFTYILGSNVIYNGTLPSFFNTIDYNNNIYGEVVEEDNNFFAKFKNKFNKVENIYNLKYAITIIGILRNIKKVKTEENIYGAKLKVKEDMMIGTINIGSSNGIDKNIEYVYVEKEKRKVISILQDKLVIKLENYDKLNSKVIVFNNELKNVNTDFFRNIEMKLPKKYVIDGKIDIFR